MERGDAHRRRLRLRSRRDVRIETKQTLTEPSSPTHRTGSQHGRREAQEARGLCPHRWQGYHAQVRKLSRRVLGLSGMDRFDATVTRARRDETDTIGALDPSSLSWTNSRRGQDALGAFPRVASPRLARSPAVTLLEEISPDRCRRPVPPQSQSEKMDRSEHTRRRRRTVHADRRLFTAER